jgi:hypothetical protein
MFARSVGAHILGELGVSPSKMTSLIESLNRWLQVLDAELCVEPMLLYMGPDLRVSKDMDGDKVCIFGAPT